MIATLISFTVEVIDGDGLAVPDLEVGARFAYPGSPTTWSNATTDGDGRARFADEHRERPSTVCVFVGDDDCGTYPLYDGAVIVVEM